MRILVTGGAGFIGSAVVRTLAAQGDQVIVVDNFTTGRERNLAGLDGDVSVHRLDIRTPLLCDFMNEQQPDAVCHLAAQVCVNKSVQDPARDASVNVLGLLSVLEASAQARVRKVVFASSGGAMYGEQRVLPTPEGATGTPASPYGITKRVAEEYLRFYRAQRGLAFTSLALANVYGPGQDANGEGGVVARFARRIASGQPPVIYGSGEQTRDFVYVDDVACAFSRALQRGNDETVNIGTAKQTSINQLFALMADVSGYCGRPEHGPSRAGEVRRSCLDNSKAARVIGWAPRVSLPEGLRRTVAALAPGRAVRLLAAA